jgi:hypothetical protein
VRGIKYSLYCTSLFLHPCLLLPLLGLTGCRIPLRVHPARLSAHAAARVASYGSSAALVGWLVGISYTVSAANPQLCPDARRGRQPTRCRCDSAPPHFTLERAICPQRPGVVWLLSTTMYFSSLEVTSFACVCVLRTMFPYVCRTQMSRHRQPLKMMENCAELLSSQEAKIYTCSETC